MTTAQSKINLAQKVLQTQDKHILKAIELLFNQEKDIFELNEIEKRELDIQLNEIESGKAKFYTMNEVKKIIRKNHKNK